MSNIKNKETVYSWSRINGFNSGLDGDGCLWSWFKSYKEGDRGEGNYFSEYGLLIHESLEKIFTNEIFEWGIENEINSGLKKFKYKAPFVNMGKSYEKKIREFFFDDGGIAEQFKKYKVLSIEDEASFFVNENKFTGFIDMVCEHEDYGLTICDFKSSKVYDGEKLDNNIKQLYLYSIAVKEKYGKYPDTLLFFYPRETYGNREYPYIFDENKLNETVNFVTDTINKIEKHTDWKPRCKDVDGMTDFFACQLCNHRNNCDYRNSFNKDPFGEDEDLFPWM